MKTTKLIFSTVILSILTACGGGGGGSAPTTPPPPVATTNRFNLLSAWQNYLKLGSVLTYTTTFGSCTTNVKVTTTPTASGAVFKGVGAFVTTQTTTYDRQNCTGQSPSDVEIHQNYYDINYMPLGEIPGNGTVNYASYEIYSPVTIFPTSVGVGDVGVITPSISYDTSLTFPYATIASHYNYGNSSYKISADTATTALLLITTTYQTQSVTDTYRLNADGTMTPINSAGGIFTHP